MALKPFERLLLLVAGEHGEAGVSMGRTTYSHFGGFRSQEVRTESKMNTPSRPTTVAHLCCLGLSPKGSTVSQISRTNWKQMSKHVTLWKPNNTEDILVLCQLL